VKLLYFADTRFPIERANGAQTMATCHALAARGHEVTLVVRPDSASPPRDPFDFYGWPRVPALTLEYVGRSGAAPARRARFLLSALRRTRTTPEAVVLTRDLGVAAFLLQVPLASRARVIYESHGIADVVAEEMPRLLGKPELSPSARKLRRLDRRERRVWRGAAAYVAITASLQADLEARYGKRDRVFVVPDGAKVGGRSGSDPVAKSAEWSDPGLTPTAGYAGHLYPWKGVDVFVRALALAPGISGLIVGGHPGEPDLERIQSLVRELGLADRVTITGLVPPRDVAARLQPATMLVLPNSRSAISERYTSPLKLFEYLTLGKPIVASDLVTLHDVLRHEQNALLVTPDDPAALAEAMRRLASDAALSAALGHAARALAPEFSWERRAERLEGVLKAAVSS
jgi:glycosyltransferase involved in cell wall biosynthesis